MQLYSVELNYVWLYDVAVISDSKVVGILPGLPSISIYLADINNVQKYDVCSNACFGSGIVDLRIYVLDTQNSKQYTMSERMKYDLYLAIDEMTNKLMVSKD